MNSPTSQGRPACMNLSARHPVVDVGRPRPGIGARFGGLFRRRSRDTAGSFPPDGGPGHRASRVVRDRRIAGLPLAAATDDLQDRSLHPLRRSRAELVRAARQRRHPLSVAGRHGTGPEVGAFHHRRTPTGRAPQCASDHRPGHRPDGGAPHAADHDDRAFQQFGFDRGFPAVDLGNPGSWQRIQSAGIPNGPAWS